jgi:TetR/AcrR family transcriptional repressor of nem operon
MGKGADTKERILEKALALIKEKGVGGASISDMLLASGIKKGALYYHFPGKDELCLAVLDRARQKLDENLDAALAEPSALKGIEAYLNGSVKRLVESKCSGGCIFGNTALEMSDSNEAYAKVVAKVFESWEGRFAETIARGQAEGEIRKDLPPATLAKMALATLEGGIMLSRIAKTSDSLKDCIGALVIFLKAP